MCFTVDKIEQACGFLLLNEFSVFVYYCKICQSEFNSGTNLEAHYILEHQEDRKNCENIFVDDGIFEDLTDLKTVVIKLEVKGSDDDDDDELISSKNEDVQLSHGYKATECDELRHGERTSREKGGNSTVNSIQSTEARDSDRFNSCSDELIEEKSNKNQATKRQIRTAGKQRACGKAPSDVYYCDMCPAITVNFNCKENLKQHMKRHIANKVRRACTICQKVPLNYEKHMKTNHLEAAPYKCDICGAAFKNNSNRVIHMRSHGERPFLCQYCGKAFKSQDTRNKHNMRVHTKKLPHHCLPCNRSFICPSQLLEHQYAFHSEERPYRCDICGNNYATKKYLRKHKQSHGERIHQCKYCQKKFKTPDTRRWHERTVHNAV